MSLSMGEKKMLNT